MAVKNRDQIGRVNCAHCGDVASVHESNIGRGGKAKSLYYRCGTDRTGCGCIQPRGPKGQAWIKANMRPMETEAAPKTTQQAEPGAAASNDEYTPGEAEKTEAKTGTDNRKGGLLGWLLEDDE